MVLCQLSDAFEVADMPGLPCTIFVDCRTAQQPQRWQQEQLELQRLLPRGMALMQQRLLLYFESNLVTFFWVTLGWTKQQHMYSVKRSIERMGQPVLTPTPQLSCYKRCCHKAMQTDSSVRNSHKAHPGPDRAPSIHYHHKQNHHSLALCHTSTAVAKKATQAMAAYMTWRAPFFPK
jgi:hypothetical protein